MDKREKAEEEVGENEEEDLIAKAEQDFFASISAELQDREKKNVERNRAFEEAKEALASGRLPHESDEKPSSDSGESPKEEASQDNQRVREYYLLIYSLRHIFSITKLIREY